MFTKNNMIKRTPLYAECECVRLIQVKCKEYSSWTPNMANKEITPRKLMLLKPIYSTLAPDDICKLCSYAARGNTNGEKQQRPVWRDPPGGQQYYPSHNIAPGSHTPVLISSKHCNTRDLDEESEFVIQPMHWGLIPSWHKGEAKNVGYETNNCRSESMLDKRTYKVPLDKGRRCVVLADGFFEWKRDKHKKQPYFIYFPQSTYIKQEKIQAKSEQWPVTEKVCKTEIGVKTNSGVKTEQKVKTELNVMEEEKTGSEIKTESLTSGKTDVSSMKSQNGSQVKVEKLDNNNIEGAPCMDSVKREAAETDSAGTNALGDRRLLTMAGVFDIWNPPDGSAPLYSYSVITIESSPVMSWIHHRMPAILTTNEEIRRWLDFGNVPLNEAVKHIHSIETLQSHPVSSVVNNSRNKSPECVKPFDPKKPKTTASSSFMMSWLSKGQKSPSAKTEPAAKRIKTENPF